MVGEGVVLRGVEHFEEGGGGVAPEIRADLVEFIEQDHRVAAFDAAQGLNDTPREGPDVGAAVAADFGLVAHAAQGDAGELPAEGIGDAAAQGGLADTGRADQAEDRPLELLAAFDDRQELEQAVLDFDQAEMLVVENPLGLGEVNFVFGFLFPGQGQNPINVVPRDRVFGGGGGHLLEAVQFLVGDVAGFGGEGGLLDAFAERAHLARVGVAFAQLTLDGAELLAKEEIALGFGDRGGDLGLDF